MKRRAWVSLAMIAVCAAVWAGGIAVPNKGFATFKGSWFDIKYPIGFKTVIREPAATGGGDGVACDGVSFISPDGLVEFYIYSPQWSGSPKWILRREGEKQTAYSVKKQGDKTVTYVTRKGPGYMRSYADYRQYESVRWVFGYKYASEAARKAYSPLYLKFKQSLKQYADGAGEGEGQ